MLLLLWLAGGSIPYSVIIMYYDCVLSNWKSNCWITVTSRVATLCRTWNNILVHQILYILHIQRESKRCRESEWEIEREWVGDGLLYAIGRWIMDACNQPPLPTPLLFFSLSLSASVSLSCSIRVHRSCHGNVNDCERPLGAHIEMHDTRGSTREGQAVGGGSPNC